MNPLSIARIAAGIVAVALAGWLIWAVNDRFKLAGEVKQHKACLVAIAKPELPLSPACEPSIADNVASARQAAGCDGALTAKNIVAIRALCPTSVKTIVADRDAQAGNLVDANQQLDGAKQRLIDAVSRAEARAAGTAKRKASNDRTIQTAPRTADGSMRCDAQCLHDLANP
ncbi:hypothetical protein QH494_06150 [Sphingomonas sp. AR_OL41]|uniref:hypothetical protein n=1 Tax=Sphingomonas sp. AR_OL41 TaxID=3042729 RepID=UPI0024809CFA|nr:hypothetical protein [Sphingomonas sp. AR_OL41]MDH7971760.1 hypothetical protein [Sphingomonas sp. AR_OL41]